MSRALTVAVAMAVASCGACSKSVPLAPCQKPDTLWFQLQNHPKTVAAVMQECVR